MFREYMYFALILLGVYLLSGCSNRELKPETVTVSVSNLEDMRVSAFYFGCIQGFINVHEMKMYQMPPTFARPEAAFAAIKSACNFSSMQYLHDIRNPKGDE